MMLIRELPGFKSITFCFFSSVVNASFSAILFIFLIF